VQRTDLEGPQAQTLSVVGSTVKVPTHSSTGCDDRRNGDDTNDQFPCPASIVRSSGTAGWPFASVHCQERVMFVNKDQIKGRAKEAKGKIKEVTGDLVGNEKLVTRGKIEKNLGKTQAKIGDVKQRLMH
jgi:uncharacterized protein YjbJ (UPF0337 family)